MKPAMLQCLVGLFLIAGSRHPTKYDVYIDFTHGSLFYKALTLKFLKLESGLTCTLGLAKVLVASKSLFIMSG